MQVWINNTQLASTGHFGPGGVSVAGRKLTDEVALIRAAAMQFWDRGARAVDVAFQVSHKFPSDAAAEKWMLEIWGLLPAEGDVTFFCGANEVYMLGAQLETAILSHVGRTIVVQYTLRGPPPQSSNPPDVVPDPDAEEEDPVIQRASVAIDSAAEEIEITFGSAFAAAPIVIVTVEVPEGEDTVTAEIEKETIATTGFTARLSAATPSANYRLAYIAIAPSA